MLILTRYPSEKLMIGDDIIVTLLRRQGNEVRLQVDEESRNSVIYTRIIDEIINISSDISIKIVGIKGNQVRLGIAAPKEVPVYREDIYERIKAEQEKLGNT